MSEAASLLVFLAGMGVKIALGGGAATATGRAVARSWAPLWHLVVYVLLLAAAARFLRFALFSEPLLSFGGFVLDALGVGAVAALAHRLTRARQMGAQYPWLFESAGPLGWRTRQPSPPEP